MHQFFYHFLKARKSLSRRILCSSFLYPFFMFFFSSCEKKKQNLEEETETSTKTSSKSVHDTSSNTVSKKVSDSNKLSDNQNVLNDPVIDNTLSKNSSCDLNTINYIKIEDIPLATEEYKAYCKLYGSISSCLIVLDFPMYQSKDLKEIFLVSYKGELLAQKAVVASADLNFNGTMKYQVFDHINISATISFFLLYKMADGKVYKYEFEEPPNFESKFQDKKIINQSAVNINPVFKDYQAHLVLEPYISFVLPESKESHISSSKIVSFKKNDSLKDFYVKDLMGKSINIFAMSNIDLVNYSSIVCYKISGDFCYRTLIKFF